MTGILAGASKLTILKSVIKIYFSWLYKIPLLWSHLMMGETH